MKPQCLVEVQDGPCGYEQTVTWLGLVFFLLLMSPRPGQPLQATRQRRVFRVLAHGRTGEAVELGPRSPQAHTGGTAHGHVGSLLDEMLSCIACLCVTPT